MHHIGKPVLVLNGSIYSIHYLQKNGMYSHLSSYFYCTEIGLDSDLTGLENT